MGLKMITESDEIFTAVEREAFWAEGLEGIEKRSNLRDFLTNYTTTGYAIRLWMDGLDEFSENTRTAVWNLIQRYKSRLLTLAIGMQRPNPPSLVQQIRASEEENLVYQEMVDLENQINITSKTLTAENSVPLSKELPLC